MSSVQRTAHGLVKGLTVYPGLMVLYCGYKCVNEEWCLVLVQSDDRVRVSSICMTGHCDRGASHSMGRCFSSRRQGDEEAGYRSCMSWFECALFTSSLYLGM